MRFFYFVVVVNKTPDIKITILCIQTRRELMSMPTKIDIKCRYKKAGG